LSVEDTMDGILNWYREEGIIFKAALVRASTCQRFAVALKR